MQKISTHGLDRLLQEVSQSACSVARLVLGVALSGHDILIIRTICILVIIVVVAISNRDPLRALLLHLFAAFGNFLRAFAGSLGLGPDCCQGSLSHRPEQRRPQLPLRLKHVRW
jgi:hypothetical protein